LAVPCSRQRTFISQQDLPPHSICKVNITNECCTIIFLFGFYLPTPFCLRIVGSHCTALCPLCLSKLIVLPTFFVKLTPCPLFQSPLNFQG
jgi:hypothetical protein